MNDLHLLALFILSIVFGVGGLVLLIVFWQTIGDMHKVPSPPPGLFPKSPEGK